MTHPSGDAIAATEHVVNAVAKAIYDSWAAHVGVSESWDEIVELKHSTVEQARVEAIAAIVAYERVMKEVAKP